MLFPSEQAGANTVFVERALYLEALVHNAQELNQKQGKIVLIAGEAGIGKTRLLHELKARLSDLPAGSSHRAPLILRGRCFEGDQTVIYAALADMLRHFFASMPPEPLELGLTPESVRSITQLLPELRTRFGAAAQDEQNVDRRAFWDGLLTFFETWSVARPLVLIVEDVHWSDEATLNFLTFLANNLAEYAILTVVTYRTNEITAALNRFLSGLDRTRTATEFILTPLSRTAVGTMLRGLLRLDRPVNTHLLETIYSLTEGNPFFVEEMVKSIVLAHSNVSPGSDIPLETLNIPRTVQVSVQQRAAQLSKGANHAVRLAAVMGRRFDFALLMKLTGESEQAVIQFVHELIAAQLIVEEAPDIYAFRHALTRQAVYNDLLFRERRSLHRTIAETIEQATINTLAKEAYIDDLAYHAYQGELWEKALHYAQSAGNRAQKLYSPHTALGHYTHALKAAERLGIAPPSALCRQRGQVYEQIGDFEAAQNDYLQAIESAQQENKPDLECQSLLDLGFLWTGRDFSRAGIYFERAIELTRASRNVQALANSLNQIGNWYANTERPFEALRRHLEALTIFAHSDQLRDRVATLDLLGVSYLLAGDMVNSVAYYHEAIAYWRQLDERRGLSSSLATLSLSGISVMTDTLYCPPKSLADSLAEGEEALQIAQTIGWQAGEAGARMYLGLGLISRGEYTYALKLGQNALELATNIEHRLWIAGAHMLLGRLYLDLLALPDAHRHLSEALALAQAMDSRFMINANSAFLGLTLIAQSKANEAAHMLDATLLSGQPADIPYTTTQRLVVAARIELILVNDDPKSALQMVDDLIRTAANLDDSSRIIPRLWYLRGRASAALNRNDEAETALRVALQGADLQGMPPLSWRVLIDLGRLYLSMGKRVEAEKEFSEARRIAKQLAEPLANTPLAETFLHATETLIPIVAPLTSRQTAKITFDGLTEREREVAVLIAQGKSNREIAEGLYISKRTVDAHIGNILSKLNFSSRAQIVRWVFERGLLASN